MNGSVDVDTDVASVDVDRLVDGIFVVVNGSVNVDPVVASVDEDSPVDGISFCLK